MQHCCGERKGGACLRPARSGPGAAIRPARLPRLRPSRTIRAAGERSTARLSGEPTVKRILRSVRYDGVAKLQSAAGAPRMQLKTILNRVEKHKSFVYGKVQWRHDQGRLSLHVKVRPRRGSRP